MEETFANVSSRMTEEEKEHLRAVLQNPDDDPPREDYAQWYEEHGESKAERDRGEFIKVQLKLAKWSEDYDSRDVRGLGRQERRLLREHGRVWAGPIAEWTYNYQFDRGFIELITIRASRFLELAQELFALAPIRHLNLIDAGEVLEELITSGYLRNIVSLSMDRCQLTDRDMVMLVNSHELIQLRWLSIGENHIGFDGVAALADASDLELEYVRLFGNPCDPGERYSHDSGRIVERWLPPEGRDLEERFSRYLPWLHLQHAKTIEEVVPNRFRQAMASAVGTGSG